MGGWMDKENLVWIKKIHIHSGILLSHEKEGNPAICDNLDETWGHYEKWNNQGQILYDITCTENLKELNS